MSGVLIRNATLANGARNDVRVAGGTIAEVGASLAGQGEDVVLDAAGGALIPGLHDHHVHLRAMAAAVSSIVVGPPDVRDAATFAARLTEAADARSVRTWIRAIGYHDSVAGRLNRSILDRLVPLHPLRVQHRSGALWIVNSCGADLLGLPGYHDGRLLRADADLHDRLPPSDLDYAAVGRAAAQRGVTGFTDADPRRTTGDVDELRRRVESGELPQRLRLMGPPTIRLADPFVTVGEVKLLLDDDSLPPLDELTGAIRTAHDDGRAAAIHCVTRTQLMLALTAFEAAGPGRGDRVEHGSVIPPEVIDDIRRLGVTIVTQPNFVAERGDRYRSEVDAADLPHLYRVRSLLDAGIPTAAGTDAPFGHADPWAAIRAAVHRRTIDGDVLGPGERISPRRALGLFLGHPHAPAIERGIAPGDPADLCLLDAPLDDVLADPTAERVAATVTAGRVSFSRDAR